MKETQVSNNPFPYSDSNKRYYTYDYYLKKTFGGKCAKIPLDAGFTCPNIDGTCGTGGCIYCSARGSGDFADATLPLRKQYESAQSALSGKWSVERCIPYLQAHTNTYAPLSVLREIYEETLALPRVVGLNIATRADCLPPDVVEYLAEIAERTVLTVELGLQSVHDWTAERIGRGHDFSTFLRGYESLRRASDKIRIGVHLILGLPDEREEDMLESVAETAALFPDEVKLHLLHVLRSSRLASVYEAGEYTPLEKDRYVDLVVRALELLPSKTVIARLTGDGMGEDLLAPDWSRRKVSVMNDIDKKMYTENTFQGRLFQ